MQQDLEIYLIFFQKLYIFSNYMASSHYSYIKLRKEKY